MSRTTFFRQSGWMFCAAIVSGICMFGVHPFSQKIPDGEYGIYGTLLAVLGCMAIPSVGLKMVFVQQGAGAITEELRRQLRGTTRGVLAGTFLIWLLMAVLLLVFRDSIIARWKISNPSALWLILIVGLFALWSPVFGGLLQGKQDFFWLGWAGILDGAGRLSGVAIIVLLFHGYATGMVTGVVLGMTLSMSVYVWRTRNLWAGPRAPSDWRAWFARVVPLTFGFGAFQFMSIADPIFVQTYLAKTENTAHYIAAGTMARALVAFTGPVAAVMFPKVVQSVAKSEKTDLARLSFLTTAGLAVLGALGLSLVAPWALTLVFKDTYKAAVPLLSWFAWCITPLTLANVLLNDLLARSQFRVVPWLVAVVGAYGLALLRFHDSFLTVIKTLGVFNLVFFGVTIWFTRRSRVSHPVSPNAAK
jgi:O-antigen/teichoic acid export membrane protein